jgi:hypothetical protein
MRVSNRNAGWRRICRIDKNFSEMEWCESSDQADVDDDFGPYAIATDENYNKHVVYDKTVTSLATGQTVTIRSNTPASCDPSTETFWSM